MDGMVAPGGMHSAQEQHRWPSDAGTSGSGYWRCAAGIAVAGAILDFRSLDKESNVLAGSERRLMRCSIHA